MKACKIRISVDGLLEEIGLTDSYRYDAYRVVLNDNEIELYLTGGELPEADPDNPPEGYIVVKTKAAHIEIL